MPGTGSKHIWLRVKTLLRHEIKKKSFSILKRTSGLPILEQGNFVFLGRLSVVNKVVVENTNEEYINYSDISSLLNKTDLVYSNGNSKIYYAISQR